MTDGIAVAIALVQAGIVVVLLVGVRRQNVPAVVNAIASFCAALLPQLVETSLRYFLGISVHFESVIALWIAVAGLLHAIGMLGPYDTVWWWDYLTHGLSAGLVAAVIFAGLIVTSRQAAGLAAAPSVVALATVAFTFAVGVFWELIELTAREIGERFDVEPVLVHYSWRDTVSDLLVDAGAAVVVVGADLRLFLPIAERFPRLVHGIVVGTGVGILVGSVVLALLVGISTERRTEA